MSISGLIGWCDEGYCTTQMRNAREKRLRPAKKFGSVVGMMSVSDRIEQSGLGDKAIAKQVGADTATVWRWRKGKSRPERAVHIMMLARVLKCEPADICPDLAAAERDESAA